MSDGAVHFSHPSVDKLNRCGRKSAEIVLILVGFLSFLRIRGVGRTLLSGLDCLQNRIWIPPCLDGGIAVLDLPVKLARKHLHLADHQIDIVDRSPSAARQLQILQIIDFPAPVVFVLTEGETHPEHSELVNAKLDVEVEVAPILHHPGDFLGDDLAPCEFLLFIPKLSRHHPKLVNRVEKLDVRLLNLALTLGKVAKVHVGPSSHPVNPVPVVRKGRIAVHF